MRTAKCSQPEKLRRWPLECPSVVAFNALLIAHSENPLTFLLTVYFMLYLWGLSAYRICRRTWHKSCQRFGATWKIHANWCSLSILKSSHLKLLGLHDYNDFSPPPFGFTSYVAGAVFDDIEGSFGDLDTLVLWDGRHFFDRLCWHDFAWQVEDFECLGENFWWQPAVLLKKMQNRKSHWHGDVRCL